MVDALLVQRAKPLVFERVLAGHQDGPGHAAGTIKGGGGARQQLDVVHIQLVQTYDIAHRKVQSRRLVVHPVDQLVHTGIAAPVESAGTHGLEHHRRSDYIDAFEVGDSIIKRSGRHFMDGRGPYSFNGYRRFETADGRPGSRYDHFPSQGGRRGKVRLDSRRRISDGNFPGLETNGGNDQYDPQRLGYRQPEMTLLIGKSTCG